jgi:hypothetical protein
MASGSCSPEELARLLGPLESIWSLNSQLPALARSRTSNGHLPYALPVAENVLDPSSNLPANLSVPEILQFDRDSHLTGILSKVWCPSAVQTGQGDAGSVFQRVTNNLIHKLC